MRIRWRLRFPEDGDTPKLHAIEQRAFGDPWPLKMFEELPEFRAIRTFLIEDHRGKIAAYAITGRDGESLELLNLAVDPPRQGQGVGSWLMRIILEYASMLNVSVMHLDVRKSNMAARHLYEKAGFTYLPETQDTYEDGEPALKMVWTADRR